MAFAIRVDESVSEVSNLPPAVLGIDLGVKKAACTTLVTPQKVSETRYFVQKEKVQILVKYDELVGQLQPRTFITYHPRALQVGNAR